MGDHHEETVSELLADIRAMEDTVLYYEQRILRKRIAIEEILHGAACKAETTDNGTTGPLTTDNGTTGPLTTDHADTDQPSPVVSGPVVSGLSVMVRGLSVRAMVESVLPELNGGAFWYPDIKRKCLARYPEAEGKIRRGIYPACHELLSNGTLIKVPGGLAKAVERCPDTGRVEG